MLDELEVAVENATARHRQRRHGVPIRVVELIVLKYLFRDVNSANLEFQVS